MDNFMSTEPPEGVLNLVDADLHAAARYEQWAREALENQDVMGYMDNYKLYMGAITMADSPHQLIYGTHLDVDAWRAGREDR